MDKNNTNTYNMARDNFTYSLPYDYKRDSVLMLCFSSVIWPDLLVVGFSIFQWVAYAVVAVSISTKDLVLFTY